MRIGTVYPDREAYRDPSVQPYFFVVRANVFQLGIVALFIPSKVLCAASGRPLVPHTIGDL